MLLLLHFIIKHFTHFGVPTLGRGNIFRLLLFYFKTDDVVLLYYPWDPQKYKNLWNFQIQAKYEATINSLLIYIFPNRQLSLANKLRILNWKISFISFCHLFQFVF